MKRFDFFFTKAAFLSCQMIAHLNPFAKNQLANYEISDFETKSEDIGML